MSGSQILALVLGLLLVLMLVLLLSWCGLKRYKKSQEPTIAVVAPGQPQTATNQVSVPPSILI